MAGGRKHTISRKLVQGKGRKRKRCGINEERTFGKKG